MKDPVNVNRSWGRADNAARVQLPLGLFTLRADSVLTKGARLTTLKSSSRSDQMHTSSRAEPASLLSPLCQCFYLLTQHNAYLLLSVSCLVGNLLCSMPLYGVTCHSLASVLGLMEAELGTLLVQGLGSVWIDVHFVLRSKAPFDALFLFSGFSIVS